MNPIKNPLVHGLTPEKPRLTPRARSAFVTPVSPAAHPARARVTLT